MTFLLTIMLFRIALKVTLEDSNLQLFVFLETL